MGLRRWSVVALVVGVASAAGFVLGSCSKGEAAEPERAGTQTEPVPTTTGTQPTTTRVPATTTAGAPVFAAEIRAVTEAELGDSWKPECPVAVDDLRLLTVTHWNDLGDAVSGEIVVHADYADDIVGVFRRLFDTEFPIHAMVPISEFEADDDLSMAANNSSGFNCREVAGRPGVWSQHSYGGAIDINPLINPWVRGSRVDPPGGENYLDRDPAVAGVIVAGDIVTAAFADIGWQWGGDWSGTVDYQHFSHNGR